MSDQLQYGLTSSSHSKLTFISVNRALCSISILSLSSTTDKGSPAHQRLHLMLEISFMHTQTWLYDQATFTPVSPSNHHQVSKFSVRRTNKKLCSCLVCSAQIFRGEKRQRSVTRAPVRRQGRWWAVWPLASPHASGCRSRHRLQLIMDGCYLRTERRKAFPPDLLWWVSASFRIMFLAFPAGTL